RLLLGLGDLTAGLDPQAGVPTDVGRLLEPLGHLIGDLAPVHVVGAEGVGGRAVLADAAVAVGERVGEAERLVVGGHGLDHALNDGLVLGVGKLLALGGLEDDGGLQRLGVRFGE